MRETPTAGRFVVLFGLLAALTMSACGGEGPTVGSDPDPGTPPTPQVQPGFGNLLSEKAIDIDPAVLSLLSDADELSAGIYRYRVASAAAPLVEVGRYLIGKASDGKVYLRRVTAVSYDGGTLSTETVEAVWAEVINGGRYTITMPLDGSDPNVKVTSTGMSLSPGLAAVTLGNTFTWQQDLCSPNLAWLGGLNICDPFAVCGGVGGGGNDTKGWTIGTFPQSLSLTLCGSVTRLEPSLNLRFGGSLDLVVDIDAGSIKPLVAPSIREVSIRGSPTIHADLGLILGLKGTATLVLIPYGVQFKQDIGKFGSLTVVIGPTLTLSAEVDATIAGAVHADLAGTFAAGWNGGTLSSFSVSQAGATSDLQFSVDGVTFSALLGAQLSVEFDYDTNPLHLLATGSVGTGAGWQQVNSRPSPCTQLDDPVPGCPPIPNWRHDSDLVWEWSWELGFAAKLGANGSIGRTVSGGNGGKIRDIRDEFGRGDLAVTMQVSDNTTAQPSYPGYPNATCGVSGTDPCEAAVWLTREVPGPAGSGGGVPSAQVDPQENPLPPTPVLATDTTFSIAEVNSLFSALPPAPCVIAMASPGGNRPTADCQLAAGLPRALWIQGVAANCYVLGATVGNKLSALPGNDFYTVVQLKPDAQIGATLSVICGDAPITFGVLEVTATTQGPQPDPDGYSVLVDGAVVGTVAANGHARIQGLPSKAGVLALGDIAGNCTVAANDRPITIPAAGTVAVTFEVTCIDPTVLGQVRVVTSSSGSDIPAGYTVWVGSSQAPIDANGSVTVSVSQGPADVRLVDVAANCSVASPNPQVVDVGGSTTTEAAFSITCKNAQAATRTPVQGTILITGGVAAGTNRGNSSKVQHIDNEVVAIDVTGGFVATGTMSRSYNLNNGTGSMSGSLTLDASFNGLSGMVTGGFAGNVKDFGGSFTWEAKGVGGLEGVLFKITFSGLFEGPYAYSGEVQNPNKQGPP